MAFPTGWHWRASITIPAASVSGSTNLTDFPVALTRACLPDLMFDPSDDHTQTDGGDIRFTLDAAGTQQLALEVVSIALDSASGAGDGQAELHVKVPTLYALTDTIIYVWWKHGSNESQPAVTDTYGRNAVWSDFFAVFHLHNGGRSDSTGQQPDLVLHTGAYNYTENGTSGFVTTDAAFGGDAFGYVGEFLNCVPTGWTGNRNDIAYSIVHRFDTTDITQRAFNFSMYLHMHAPTNLFAQRAYIQTGSQGAGAPYATAINSGGTYVGDGGPSVSATNVWHHVGATAIDGASIELAVDGAADGATVASLPNPGYTIGRIGLGTNGSIAGQGVYDEARVWKEGVPIEVLQTEGNNLLSFPGTFASAGAPVDQQGPAQNDATATTGGTEATSATGTATATANASVTVTGSAATSATGTAAATGAATSATTSNEVTSATGTALAAGAAHQAVTGTQVDSANGNTAEVGDALTGATGAQVDSSTGTVSATGAQQTLVIVTGSAVTSGTESVSVAISAATTGEQVTSGEGAASVNATGETLAAGSITAITVGSVTVTGAGVIDATGTEVAISTGTAKPILSSAVATGALVQSFSGLVKAGTLLQVIRANGTLEDVDLTTYNRIARAIWERARDDAQAYTALRSALFDDAVDAEALDLAYRAFFSRLNFEADIYD